MHRHQDFGPQPAIERLEFGAAGVAGDVDLALPVGHHHDPALGKLVLDPADGNLVAGNLAAREQHDVALVRLDRVIVLGNARQRRARLALPAGGHDQHLAARQAHRGVEIDRLREMLQGSRCPSPLR